MPIDETAKGGNGENTESLPSLEEFFSGKVTLFDSPDAALGAYADAVARQLSGGREAIHRSAAGKQLTAFAIAAAVAFIAACGMMVYHRSYLLFIAVFAIDIAALLIARKKLTGTGALVKKLAAMPDADVRAVLVSECRSLVPVRTVKAAKILIACAAAAALVAIFARPHMIFEDNDTGCGVRFYTMSFSADADVYIPDFHDGKPVTEIRGNVFQGLRSIRSVRLPDGITEIRGYTFKSCSRLASVTIPEGVVRVGGHAFENCSNLSSVKFPSTLRSIGSSAFRNCRSLRSVKIPYGCSVDTRAFKDSPTNVNRY